MPLEETTKLAEIDKVLRDVKNIDAKMNEAAQLALLSSSLKLLPTITNNANRIFLLNSTRCLFKTSSDSWQASKLEEIICNNIDELNNILVRNNDMEWLFMFLSTYPEFISFDAQLNYIETVLQDRPLAWQLFSDCFSRLSYVNDMKYVEKITSAAETLFKALVVDEETSEEFLEFSEQNESTIDRCFDRHDILNEFLYSIFGSYPKLITFESKIKNISSVSKYFGKSEQHNLLAEFQKQFQKWENFQKQTEIAVAFLSLLATQNYTETEICEILAMHANTINSMLLLVANDPQAKFFYSIFLGNQKFLSLDVRVRYCGKELLDLNEHEQRELLHEILLEFETFDDLKNMSDYLSALEILLPNFLRTGSDLEVVKEKIVDFALTHSKMVDQALMNEVGFPLFSRGAFLFVMGTNLMEFNSGIKFKYFGFISGKMSKEEQQKLLAECLQQIKKRRNLKEQHEIAIVYFSLLAAQNYSQEEISAITVRNASKIDSMLLQAVNYPQAKYFYSIFLECQKFLSLDVRVKYCAKELVDLSENHRMELFHDILLGFKNFDDLKNMFDYLAALEILLPSFFQTGSDLKSAKRKIVNFALIHKETANQVLMSKEGFSIFARGAFLSVLGNKLMEFENDVKFKYFDIIKEQINESFLWHILAEYLKQIDTGGISLLFEEQICTLLLNFSKNGHYRSEFVEQLKPILISDSCIKSISSNSSLRSFLLSIPSILSLETRHGWLTSMSLSQKYDWLDECFEKFGSYPLVPILAKIDNVCGSINGSGSEKSIEENFNAKIDRHASVIIRYLIPQSRMFYFESLQRLLEKISFMPLILAQKLGLLQKQLKPRVCQTVRLKIVRKNALESSFLATSNWPALQWSMKFKIEFNNEPGVDMSGLLKEWFTITTREILNPNFGLFIPTPGDPNNYMINKSSHVNQDHLKYFKFIGRFLAKGILENIHLNIPLAKVLFKHIIGAPIEYSDFKSQDPEFFNSLCYILNNPISEVGLDLTFSTEIEHFGVFEDKELIENGKNIPVTDENKHDYVRLVSKMKMTDSINPQLMEFLSGFYSVIPKNLIMMFDEKQLEILLCGRSEIDIEDLKRNTKYRNYQESDYVIQWFWEALRSFSREDRERFLMYTTGSSRAPLLGFAFLRGSNGFTLFNISADHRGDSHLPTAHTCFNQLDLPRYTSHEKLREKLLFAIREGAEGFGMA